MPNGHAGIAGVVSVGIPLQASSPRSLEVYAAAPSLLARVARFLKGTFSVHLFPLSLLFFASARIFLQAYCHLRSAQGVVELCYYQQ